VGIVVGKVVVTGTIVEMVVISEVCTVVRFVVIPCSDGFDVV
jgi:hypothetical protein